ncbi:MAG: ribokinase [Oscillospiraceae bacterium]
MRILNFGSLNLDHVYTVDHFVTPGETTGALGYTIYFGGKGHNQSIALARAGADVWHAGRIGADGESIYSHMKENGVKVDYTTPSQKATGHAIIQVDKNGQNAIIVYPGANGDIDAAYAGEVLQNFGRGDTMLVQNEISNLPCVIKKAKERGMRIILNPSPITPAILECPLEFVDVFVVNEVEGEALSGEKDGEKMIAALTRQYPHAEILLTLGKNGAIFASGGQRTFQPIYDSPVVDTTAAGDTFTGYFITWYLGGKTAAEALSAATMASAIAVSRPGAAASIPTKAEVLEKLQQL